MELEIDLFELDLDLEVIVEWEFDPEYSPVEGMYNKFIWTAYLYVDNQKIDITGNLSKSDTKFINAQIEESCCE
jgi:hypothetical protein